MQLLKELSMHVFQDLDIQPEDLGTHPTGDLDIHLTEDVDTHAIEDLDTHSIEDLPYQPQFLPN